jgi:hypothetical protein
MTSTTPVTWDVGLALKPEPRTVRRGTYATLLSGICLLCICVLATSVSLQLKLDHRHRQSPRQRRPSQPSASVCKLHPPLQSIQSSLYHPCLILIIIIYTPTLFQVRLFSVIKYESLIHEFDPWFNYRVTLYLSKEGFYNTWNFFDSFTWYPLGRVVGGTMYPVGTKINIYLCIFFFPNDFSAGIWSRVERPGTERERERASSFLLVFLVLMFSFFRFTSFHVVCHPFFQPTFFLSFFLYRASSLPPVPSGTCCNGSESQSTSKKSASSPRLSSQHSPPWQPTS